MIEETTRADNEKLLESEARKYGIKCIPVDYFHLNGFRYTDLKDAVAAARRMNVSKVASV